jgi:flavin-dependent dehydrogenase
MWDVVVVGGGPAGSSIARELRRRGLSVAIVERARFPRPKACGEGLMPRGVRALPSPFRGTPFRGLRFVAPSGTFLDADFPDGTGLAVPRAEFDAFLREASGAEVFEGVAYDAARFPARRVVAADGLRSAFHGGGVRRGTRVALTADLDGLADPPDRVEIYFHDGGEVYLAPSGHVACLCWRAPWGGTPAERLMGILRGVRALAPRLGRARPAGEVLGAGPLGLRVRGVVRGEVLLAGDAAGAPDPITGEGMALALELAPFAAEAIARDDPSLYVREHRRRFARVDRLGRLLLRVSRWGLAERLVRRIRPAALRRLMDGDIGLFDLLEAFR